MHQFEFIASLLLADKGAPVRVNRRSHMCLVTMASVPNIEVMLDNKGEISLLLGDDDPSAYNDHSVPKSEWESGFADFQISTAHDWDRALGGAITEILDEATASGICNPQYVELRDKLREYRRTLGSWPAA